MTTWETIIVCATLYGCVVKLCDTFGNHEL
jgi:hypothetical protein